jgi:hypothetical protein
MKQTFSPKTGEEEMKNEGVNWIQLAQGRIEQ